MYLYPLKRKIAPALQSKPWPELAWVLLEGFLFSLRRFYNHIIQIMDLSITNMNGITKAELNIQLPPIQNSKPGGIDHKRAYTP